MAIAANSTSEPTGQFLPLRGNPSKPDKGHLRDDLIEWDVAMGGLGAFEIEGQVVRRTAKITSAMHGGEPLSSNVLLKMRNYETESKEIMISTIAKRYLLMRNHPTSA
jgi:hypothetical protein